MAAVAHVADGGGAAHGVRPHGGCVSFQEIPVTFLLFFLLLSQLVNEISAGRCKEICLKRMVT